MAGADHGPRTPRRRPLPASGIPGSPTSQGDACALPFPDGAFDVVHSNAVIEHVGGRERQEAFVREALRVGRRVFLTTPNRWFPIEVHTRLPLVHWLPDPLAGARLRPRRGSPGRRRTTFSARPTCARSSPCPCGSQPRHDARGDDVTDRLPRVALLVLVVGLALHNLAMAVLWQAGVRDTALDVVAAWKDVLLLVALVVALAAAGVDPRGSSGPTGSRSHTARSSSPTGSCRSRGSTATATARGELYALRHHLLPLGAYVLGRLVPRPRLVAANRRHARRRRRRARGLGGSSTSTSSRSSGGATPASPTGSTSSSGSPTAASRTCRRTGS